MTKRPTLEKIEPGFGSSFTIRQFSHECGQANENPYWHFHPEYEIVYITNGRGKRHVGHHISFFEDGDLIFLGPNLPHLSFTQDMQEDHQEIVVQLRGDFLGSQFMQRPEMRAIQLACERARSGLSFSGEVKKRVGRRLRQMVSQEPFERLMSLLWVLQELGTATEYQSLNADGLAFDVNAQDRVRMEKIYGFVQQHFRRNISLDEIAGEVNMTTPAFCRYFKKMTRRTFTQFVNEMRIAHACRLLAADDLTIAAVGFESGFNNLSHFNKQFRAVTEVTPRAYRQNLRQVVH